MSRPAAYWRHQEQGDHQAHHLDQDHAPDQNRGQDILAPVRHSMNRITRPAAMTTRNPAQFLFALGQHLLKIIMRVDVRWSLFVLHSSQFQVKVVCQPAFGLMIASWISDRLRLSHLINVQYSRYTSSIRVLNGNFNGILGVSGGSKLCVGRMAT